MSINEKIKELRTEKGLTQKELSKVLGIGQSTISEWEKGIYEPTASAIKMLAIYFNVTADYLLGLEDESGGKYNNSFNNFTNSGSINIR